MVKEFTGWLHICNLKYIEKREDGSSVFTNRGAITILDRPAYGEDSMVKVKVKIIEKEKK